MTTRVIRGEGHKDLMVWRKAMDVVTEIYRETRTFPKDKIYGLTNQLRRADVSVPSNVAEGHGRTSKKEFRQFVCQARGSILEVETQLEIAANLGYLSKEAAARLRRQANEIGRMLNGPRQWCEAAQAIR